MNKICVATATRAEYGLLKPLMDAINNHPNYTLQVLVTGAHLSPEFGMTVKQIEIDGFAIDEKVEMLLSADTATSIVKSMGVGMIGYADALSRLQPDAIVILGDRYEMLSVATAAAVFKIPIMHLHGGEVTEGAYDEAFRHCISKMSHIHFTTSEEHKNRVLQLGENPEFVFNVGAVGIDNIMNIKLLSKEALGEQLQVNWKKHIYQITYHPETLSDVSSEASFKEILSALSTLEDTTLIFTKANADTDGRIINQMIDEYVAQHEDAYAFTSLGALRFLSLLSFADGIIGNSSSGLIEAPTFKIPTINIGDRQKGRMKSVTVLDTPIEKEAILNTIAYAKTDEFKAVLKNSTNPYGDGNATSKIMDILNNINFKNLGSKAFFDLKTI